MTDRAFDLISKIIKLIGLRSFQSLLWGKVKEAFRESFESTQLEFDFQRTKPDPGAIEYLKTRQFILSKKTVDRLHGDLRLNLLEGIHAGDSIKELMKRIEPIFDRMKNYELERLARTETINAMNMGRLNAYEKSGVVKYVQWKSHKDARTSDICRRLDGQIIRLGEELFTDPVTGEQFRNPPAHPNCRSTIIPLRKLPEVTYNSGYRYVAKIEFDIGLLAKQERRIYIKPYQTKRGTVKGHYRTVKTGREREDEIDIKLSALQNYRKAVDRTNDWIEHNPDRHEDISSVYNYTIDSYDEINYYLREGKLMEDVEEEGAIVPTLSMTKDRIIEISNSISRFLRDAPKFNGIVYRGMYFRTETERGLNKFNTFMKNINNSSEITLKSFTSTSARIEEAEKCIRKSKPGKGNIIFKIKSNNGVALGNAAAFPKENEVLFDKNSRFKIISVVESNDNTCIELEEIQ